MTSFQYLFWKTFREAKNNDQPGGFLAVLCAGLGVSVQTDSTLSAGHMGSPAEKPQEPLHGDHGIPEPTGWARWDGFIIFAVTPSTPVLTTYIYSPCRCLLACRRKMAFRSRLFQRVE